MNAFARASVATAVASVLQACATAPLPATEAQPAQSAALEPAERAHVARLAPDFLARAERARERARAAEDPEAVAEHAACADVLLEAARVEAARIELARQLAAEELRRDAALRALAAERYRALARESEAVLARAASDPATGIGTQSAREASAAELTRRARLQLAAARVLGADATELEKAERQVRRVDARPAEARAALELAERVLAAARSRSRMVDATTPNAGAQ